MTSEPVELRLEEQAFAGWTSVRVSRSLETASGSFELQVSDPYPDTPELRVLRAGQQCSVHLGSDTVLTGYVDKVSTQIDARGHSVRLIGRDKVADLIDCAPDHPPSEWLNVTLLELAQALAKPFGIPVRTELDLGDPFAKVTLNIGQRAMELIAEHCRYRQALPVSDGKGTLELIRASTQRTTASIVEGENLLTGELTQDASQRHSAYFVRGQTSDLSSLLGGKAGKPQGMAEDPAVTRHRPLCMLANQASNEKLCQQRAEWEATYRKARATRANVSVQGWRDGQGELWQLNRLVSVRSPTLGLNGELLISAVDYRFDGGGTISQLTLDRPDAFSIQPIADPSQSGLQGLINP